MAPNLSIANFDGLEKFGDGRPGVRAGKLGVVDKTDECHLRSPQPKHFKGNQSLGLRAMPLPQKILHLVRRYHVLFATRVHHDGGARRIGRGAASELKGYASLAVIIELPVVVDRVRIGKLAADSRERAAS